MTCRFPRAPHRPGMRTSSLTLSLSPIQDPEEGPQAQLVSAAHRGELRPAREVLGMASRESISLRSDMPTWHSKNLSCDLLVNTEGFHIKMRISGFF